MREEIVSDTSSSVDDHVGEQSATVADFHSLLDYHIGSDGSALSDLCAGIDDCSLVNSMRSLWCGIKELKGMSEGKIGIFVSEQRTLEGREVIPHDDERRLSRS